MNSDSHLKIISWNVNGLRSVAKKGFLEYMAYENPDVVCLQEVRADLEDLDDTLKKPLGYSSVFFSAKKKGYSGVGLYYRNEPKMTRGLGLGKFDDEGRTIIADFGSFTIMNAYFPNSQRGHARLDYKIDYCNEFLKTCSGLVKKGKNLIICGDMNISHKEIDLANPKTNMKNAGFLPEERGWMDQFVKAGFVDAFREFQSDGGHYTWWSNRPGVRERNIGWRLDYFFINAAFRKNVISCTHQSEVMGSDHCPVLMEISQPPK